MRHRRLIRRRVRRRLVARIFGAIDRFAGWAPQFGDITVMVLKKL